MLTNLHNSKKSRTFVSQLRNKHVKPLKQLNTMNNVIYLVQVSEDKAFTKIYFNKIFAEKEYAIQGYQVTEEINNKNTNKGYCRLLEIPFEFGFGYDKAGITIRKNY